MVIGTEHSLEPEIEAKESGHGAHVADELAPLAVLNVYGAHFEQAYAWVPEPVVIKENFPAAHGEHSSSTLGEEPGGHVWGHPRRAEYIEPPGS